MGLFSAARGATDMTIDTMTEGVSKDGVETLVETMKAELLVSISEKLKATDAISTAIKAGWQGKSRDDFLDSFSKAINAVRRDLAAEYTDVLKRLAELIENYFKQDQEMMDRL